MKTVNPFTKKKGDNPPFPQLENYCPPASETDKKVQKFALTLKVMIKI
jgi:hypothetical protein